MGSERGRVKLRSHWASWTWTSAFYQICKVFCQYLFLICFLLLSLSPFLLVLSFYMLVSLVEFFWGSVPFLSVFSEKKKSPPPPCPQFSRVPIGLNSCRVFQIKPFSFRRASFYKLPLPWAKSMIHCSRTGGGYSSPFFRVTPLLYVAKARLEQ